MTSCDITSRLRSIPRAPIPLAAQVPSPPPPQGPRVGPGGFLVIAPHELPDEAPSLHKIRDKELAMAMLALKVGEGMVWDHCTSSQEAVEVRLRKWGKRFRAKWRTYLDAEGRRIVVREANP